MTTTPTSAPTTLDPHTIELINLVVKTTLVELQTQTQAPAPAPGQVTPAPDAERKATAAAFELAACK